MNNPQHDVDIEKYDEILKNLMGKAFQKAKRWSGAETFLAIFLFAAGIIAIFVPRISPSYPWVALPLALVGVLFESRASKSKDKGEELKRQHEYLMGFGVAPSKSVLADTQQDLPGELPNEVEKLLSKGVTYWSKQPHGPARVLENLLESSWFTKHHAKFCENGLAAVFWVSLACSVSLLLFCATSLAGSPTGQTAVSCIAATLLFLISVGILRTWSAFGELTKKAGAVDEKAEMLLEAKNFDVFEVQKLLCEYQIARASGPLIPTWVWRLQRYNLNKSWKVLKHPNN